MPLPVPVAIAVSVMEVAIYALQGAALACRNAEYPQAADMLDSTAKQLAERGVEMIRGVQGRIVAPSEMPKGTA